jgi:hypothetical protein
MGGKKGMDRGIDGYLHFRDPNQKPQFRAADLLQCPSRQRRATSRHPPAQ